MPVMKQYMSTEALVKGPLPQFGYQLHLAGPEVEATIQTKEQIRQFLNGIYGGRGPNGELAFDPVKGILFDNLPKLGKSKLLSDKVRVYYFPISKSLRCAGLAFLVLCFISVPTKRIAQTDH